MTAMDAESEQGVLFDLPCSERTPRNDGGRMPDRLAGMMKSDRTDWNTPASLLTVVRRFAGELALDPCSGPGSIVQARSSYSPEGGSDGLALSWATGPGVVYANPPYGAAIGAWVEKAKAEAAAGVEIAMLVPARTDTAWFHSGAEGAQAICFWRGRLRFLGAPSSAPFPSALLYWGPNRFRFADVFSAHGKVVLL